MMQIGEKGEEKVEVEVEEKGKTDVRKNSQLFLTFE